MKTKNFLIILLAITIASCASLPRYLPSSGKIDVNEYGSYIKITRKLEANIDGELIAIYNNKIVVLTEETRKCVTIPINKVKRFSLRYSQPKHYGWTIPLLTLATTTHGYFLILTAPLNLIVTTSVTVSGENAFKYSNKSMTFSQLKMFARFPQGIPTNIDIASIK